MSQVDETYLSSLVEPTRVHRDVYTNAEIFRLEMERIYDRVWIYVGHDSQLRKPGDYLTTRIGLHPVIVTRQEDGAIAVVHNRCAHRGAMICTEERGSGRYLRCPYHAWTYRMDGSLVAVPMPAGYADFHDRRNTLGLKRVPRVSAYRGFIFASIAPEGPDLESFLGPITSAFDDLVDRAPEGEVEVTGGVFRTVNRGNWKIQIENSNDAVHPHATHRSAIDALKEVTAPTPPNPSGAHGVDVLKANGAPLKRMDEMGAFACRNGHSYIGSLPVPPRAGKCFEEYRARLVEVHGEARADEILSVSRHQNVVFPNIIVHGAAGRIKVIQPVAVDKTETYAYAFRLKGAPEEMTREAIRALNRANSPAALLFSDDLEMWMRCQEGMSSTPGHEWIDFSRDVGRESADDNGGYRANGLSELTMRNGFQAWRQFMLGDA